MADATTETAAASTPEPGEYEVPEWLSLDPDEEIQWIGEPVPISIVGTAVWGVILIPFLIGLLVLALLPFSWIGIKNTDFVITNKSLYVKKGVLSTNIESVGLDKIQNTEYSQSFWGKQFDYGKIDISTAGSAGAQISFQNIENARSVRERITRLSNEYSAGSHRSSATDERGTGGAAETPTGGTNELVEELRATREALERIERKMADSSGGDGASPADESRLEWESDAGPE